MSASARLPNILVIGTGDTKSDELLFMADIIGKAAGLQPASKIATRPSRRIALKERGTRRRIR